MRTRVIAVVATALALAASGVTSASAAPPSSSIGCDAAQSTISQDVVLAEWRSDVGTGEQGGVPDAIGAVDTKWSTTYPAEGPAYSIAANGAWVTSPRANWISSGRPGGPLGGGVKVGLSDVVTVDTGATGALPTETRYRLAFDMPELTIGRALVFDYAADNGVRFYLNGTLIGAFDPLVATPQAFHAWHSLVYTGPAIHTGTNILEAHVTDYGVATGFVVDGGARACLVRARAGYCLRLEGSVPTTYRPQAVDISTAPGVPYTLPAGAWHTVGTATGLAYSVAPNPAWITTPGANWVNDTTTSYSGPFSPVTRRFEVRFDLGTGTQYRDLDFRFAVDNAVTFLLNGVPIPGAAFENGEVSPAFRQFHPVTWTGGGFVDGVNRLEALVTDYGGSRGLLVEGLAHTCNPALTAG